MINNVFIKYQSIGRRGSINCLVIWFNCWIN